MKVVGLESLRRSPTAFLFEGAEAIAASMFVTRYARDQGPDLHFHPYAELFLVQEGEATFSVDGEDHVVAAGNVVVVPPEAVHGFKNRADAPLGVVSVHPSARVEQTNL